MFEYLNEILAEEKEKYKANPQKYKAGLETQEFLEFTFEKLNSSADRANYTMAHAIKVLVSHVDKGSPSPKNKLTLMGRDPIIARYLWTALVLLGNNIPEQFDRNSIDHWALGFNEREELGWVSPFGNNSLYETNFKIHLNKDKIRNFLEKGNEAYLKYLEEQEGKRKKAAADARAKAERIKQENERKAAAKKIEDQKHEIIRREKEEKKRVDTLNLKLHGLFSSDNFSRGPKEIKSLLEQKACVNHQDKDGYTALMLAANANDGRCAEYLLNLGANPLLRNKYDEKASALSENKSMYKGYELIYAVSAKDMQEVKAICCDDELGDFINFKTSCKTALSIAVKENQTDMVGYLLARGADPYLEISPGRTSLLMAVENQQKDILSCFLSHAVKTNEVKIVRYLLSQGADPDLPDSQGQKPVDLIDDETDQSIIEALYNSPAPSEAVPSTRPARSSRA